MLTPTNRESRLENRIFLSYVTPCTPAPNERSSLLLNIFAFSHCFREAFLHWDVYVFFSRKTEIDNTTVPAVGVRIVMKSI